MKDKLFHGKYDGTASIEISTTCTECEAEHVSCVSYVAEHNAGELYTVNVCAECLSSSLDMLRATKRKYKQNSSTQLLEYSMQCLLAGFINSDPNVFKSGLNALSTILSNIKLDLEEHIKHETK